MNNAAFRRRLGAIYKELEQFQRDYEVAVGAPPPRPFWPMQPPLTKAERKASEAASWINCQISSAMISLKIAAKRLEPETVKGESTPGNLIEGRSV